MSDVAIPSAGSSPASNTPAAAAPAENAPAPLQVPRDKAAYAEWRKTGKVPDANAKPKEGSASSDSGSAGADDGDSSGEADLASEAGKNKQDPQRQKPRGDAATRLNEILGDLKRAGLTPAELKSFKRSLRDGQPENPVIGTAQPPAPAAAATPAAQAPPPAKLEAPKKPNVDDFDSYAKYEEARDQWQADNTRFEIAQAIEGERTRWLEAETTRRNTAMLEAAGERYGADSKAVILNTAQALVGNKELPGVIAAMFNDSPVLGDLLYVMGSKADELNDFVALCKRSPGEAVRKLAVVEHLVREELASKAGKSAAPKGDGGGAAARDGDGKFTAASTPAKKITSAPAPPSETGGRSAAPPDEVEQAVTAKDFRAFRRAANERDLAARSGR